MTLSHDGMNLEHLRQAGRSLDTPFTVQRTDGRTVRVIRVLRHLPEKRITAEALADGNRVLAKLFIGHGSARHWARELAGIRALHDAGIPTAALNAAEALPDGGHLIMTDFLDAAVTLASRWQGVAELAPGAPAAEAMLEPAFRLLGQLHRAGLTHEDVHFGNFLACGPELLVVDGDAVKVHARTPVDNFHAIRNLGMLVAQLPMDWEPRLAPLLDAYRSGHPQAAFTNAELASAVEQARAERLADYLGKVRRNCTLFKVEHGTRKLMVVMRDHANALAPLLANPDEWISSGTVLKDGRSATVVKLSINGLALIVKRYNIKNSGHALSRAWRPSRAWHAWVEGHRLRLLGIPTPTPLAVIETRLGPLRGRAWLVSEYYPGITLRSHFEASAAREPEPAEGVAIRSLFDTLYRARISHGDLKSLNLLWHRGRLSLIDLDAMVQHRSDAAHLRAWKKDRARLLRNWSTDSALHHWLDANLPPAGAPGGGTSPRLQSSRSR